MHAPRGRSQPRVLYWFRTPPNVRVGRPALDEDAIRTIEESNPELTFDWPQMLKAQPPPAPAPAAGGRAGVRERRGRGARSRGAERRPGPDRSAGAPGAPPPAAEPPDEAVEAAQAMLAVDAGPETGGEEERTPLPPGLHVAERLGPEGFSRLRARYAELMARIAERVTEPARLEQLREQAERLNPDTWITDDEARAGIEGFDGAYEALRAQLGRRRRRSRRGGVRRRQARLTREAGGAAEPGEAGAPPDGEDVDDPDAPEGPDHDL